MIRLVCVRLVIYMIFLKEKYKFFFGFGYDGEFILVLSLSVLVEF